MNSSSMSLMSASLSASAAVASYTGTTSPETGPCIGGRDEGKTTQKNVKVGDVVEVTFRGSPPYNLSRSVEHNGVYFCDTPIQGNVTANTWSWTVTPFFWPSDQGGPNATVLEAGDTVVFAATELTTGLVNNYYSSSNFSVVTEEDSASPAISTIKVGLVFGLVAATTLLTLV